MNLFVSLPKNDIALAEAAARGGAHGVKVHLNAFHRASGTTFGTFEQERPFLNQLSALGLRKFIMAGQETIPTEPEMMELERLGFEGFNLYLRHAKSHLFRSNLRPILALDHGFTDKDIEEIQGVSDAWIEASVMDFSQYGQALTPDDLRSYEHIVRKSGRKVIVPSQKKLIPSDLRQLAEVGVDSTLLGIIVVGSTPETIESTVRAFVEALPA